MSLFPGHLLFLGLMPSVCEHDSKYAVGSSFSSPDRPNPCENSAAVYTDTAALGATTPASSLRSHMLHEISGRDAVMQGHA